MQKGSLECEHIVPAGGFVVPPILTPGDQGCACLGSVYICMKYNYPLECSIDVPRIDSGSDLKANWKL